MCLRVACGVRVRVRVRVVMGVVGVGFHTHSLEIPTSQPISPSQVKPDTRSNQSGACRPVAFGRKDVCTVWVVVDRGLVGSWLVGCRGKRVGLYECVRVCVFLFVLGVPVCAWTPGHA